jgi:pimeloyl-ACP methyl ester carboxylesterase
MENPVIFVHGHGHSSFCWANFEKIFKEKGFNTYLFNYRNHGKNIKKTNIYYTNMDYAKDLKEYIDNNIIENYTIIAHSAGCIVTHYAITKYGINPKKLFLLGPLQDNYILDVWFHMVLDINLWPLFITNIFQGKRLIKYALFSENTDEKIIEECEKNIEFTW